MPFDPPNSATEHTSEGSLERADVLNPDFARVVEDDADGVTVFDREWRYCYVNAAAERMIGSGRIELIGRSLLELWPDAERADYFIAMTRAMNERIVVSALLASPQQPGIWWEARCVPLQSDALDGGIVVHWREITEQRRLESALEQSEARFRLQADTMPQMVWATDPQGNHLYYNRRWYEYTGQSVEESLGFGFTLALHPDDLERTLEQWQKAWLNGEEYDIEYRFRRFDGVYRWFVGRAEPVRDPETGAVTMWAGTCTDIEDLKRAQDELRASETALREQGEFLRRVIESSPDCIKTLDLDGRLVAITRAGQKLLEIDDFGSVCGLQWLDFWDGDGRQKVRDAIETAKAGGTGRFHGFCATAKGHAKWWDVVVAPILDADGRPEQLLVVSRDITERQLAEDRERRRLTAIFMQAPAFMAATRGPEHTFELANPPYYQLIGHRDIIGRPVAEALPEVTAQGFVEVLDHVYRTGKPYSGKGVRIMLQVEPAGGLEERIVDFTYQPLFGDDGAVSGLLAHGIDLTERVLLEEERERLLAESRARADREILLNRIGIEARRTMEPDSILQAAISALGEGLGADRCYFVRYDQTRDTARVFPEWYRDGTVIEPLTGRIFQMSSLSVDRDPGYKTGNTHVVNDVVAYSPDDAAPFVALQIRAILRVPIEVGDQMTALAVAMAMEPREWTEGEIRLVENVASLVRSTLESAHLQQRERNIAQQLQAALQPDPPADLPGVALASYYRPALQEAGVGGDAFDVFSIKDGCTALCVFDLSGKGLRAAAAVATVRNSVRFAVYNGLTISAALTNVNRTLVEHGLIDGFATLFLGVYDERCRSLTYVNCGQEPGLIRRAGSAEIELLMPTGPVLGGFIEGVFTERTVAVDPGDILAIFTDGLTEVGATRQNLLGIEGVSEILQASCDAATEICDPKLIITRLIEGVDAFAADGVRDDIAVLIGVFEQ